MVMASALIKQTNNNKTKIKKRSLKQRGEVKENRVEKITLQWDMFKQCLPILWWVILRIFLLWTLLLLPLLTSFYYRSLFLLP